MTDNKLPSMSFAMHPDIYEHFVKSIPKIVVDDKTSELRAGYMLGIQFVLDKLRHEIVLPR